MAYEVRDQYGVLTVTEPDSPREIRFITPEYREQFRIRDGESVLLSVNGTRREVVCRYLDDYHLVFAGRGYHICELAEALQRMGALVEPLPEKRTVWSDHDLNLRDWIKDLVAEEPGLTREEYETCMVETNAGYLDDERANLDIPVDGDILVICDLGLWDGRHSGYTLIPDGNLSDCLQYRYDSAEWYVTKDGEFCSSQWHHDGCNHYTFRKFRDGATEDERSDLLEKLYDGTAKQADIDRVTEKLGYRVGEVYGWHFPDEKTKERGRER